MTATTGAEVLTVLVADDNPVIRMGLRLLLDADAELAVVAEAGDGDEALALARRLHPDVVLLDVRMPRRGGLEVLPELAAECCVLMLTSSDEDETIRAALAAGARGYLVYGTVDEQAIVQGIKAAARGGAVLSAQVARALVTPVAPAAATAPAGPALGAAARDAARRAGLSDREIAVMELIAAGRSNTEIAGALFLAPKTVKNHINRIFAKLHVTTRSEAMALWLGTGVRPAPQGPGAAADWA